MTSTPAPTLVDAMIAAAQDGKVGITFIGDDESSEWLSYAEILARSQRMAGLLRERGLAPGARVPLVLPTEPAFMVAFFGIMLAGAIPVPISMPAGFGSIDLFGQRFTAISDYVGATHAIVAPDLVAPLGSLRPALAVMAGIAVPPELPALPSAVPPSADDIAFIQCTSGSTGTPKGVMLTHRNLVVNTGQMMAAFQAGPTDVMVSWLPLNHDMGLICGALLPMRAGFHAVLSSPTRFQRRPVTWLQTISRYRGTISPAPNFAYGYTTARPRDAELEGVDLSSWRLALCGAEPIDQRTLNAFAQRFASRGLSALAIRPGYGLAEATLAVTFSTRQPFIFDHVDRQALAAGAATATTGDGIDVVACGAPFDGTQLRIVDDQGAVLPDGSIGHIHVSGPTIMKGYYQLPEETAAVLQGGWLDTGDIGYLRDGELRITGRAKDLIIVRGQKYAPTDFEWAAEKVEGVRRGTAVAFSAPSPERAGELLYIVCETDASEDQLEPLRAEIGRRVSARTGLRPDVVVLSRERRVIPKTTSGKLQRRKTRDLVLAGVFPTGRA